MRLTTAAAEAIRANVFLAGGREVCFVGSLELPQSQRAQMVNGWAGLNEFARCAPSLRINLVFRQALLEML